MLLKEAVGKLTKQKINKYLSKILEKVGLYRSTSHTTSVRGYHNVSAGFTITSDEDGKTAFINFSGGSTALKAAHEAVPKRVQQAVKALKADKKLKVKISKDIYGPQIIVDMAGIAEPFKVKKFPTRFFKALDIMSKEKISVTGLSKDGAVLKSENWYLDLTAALAGGGVRLDDISKGFFKAKRVFNWDVMYDKQGTTREEFIKAVKDSFKKGHTPKEIMKYVNKMK